MRTITSDSDDDSEGDKIRKKRTKSNLMRSMLERLNMPIHFCLSYFFEC